MRHYRRGASAAVLAVLLSGATSVCAQSGVETPLSVVQASFRSSLLTPQLVWTRGSAGEASVSDARFPVEDGANLAVSSLTQQDLSSESQSRQKNWLIEPIKLTSLMVNTHPEYNGWGLEGGRRLTERTWVTSMIEKTKGGDFLKNFDPEYDFLITFRYFAWLNTFRYYLKPDARYSTFFDAGVEYQSAGHKFLRDNDVFEEGAKAAGPILFVGGAWRFSENMYLKWRSGFFVNLYRGGDMKSRIDDGQDQPAFFMYPHLADAVIGRGTYAGDVAFGITF